MNIKHIAIFILLTSVAIGYLVYLDYGCTNGGMMTWQGKECIGLSYPVYSGI